MGMDLAAIHAVWSTRTALSSGRLGRSCRGRPQCNMHRGQVPGHCGLGGRLTPRLKASESPWALAAGAADILRAASLESGY